MSQIVRHLKRSFHTDVILEPARVIPHSIAAKFAAWLLSKTNHDVVAEWKQDRYDYQEFHVNDARKMLEAIFDHRACRMALDDEIDRVVVGRKHYEQVLRYQIDHPLGIMVDVRLREYNEVYIRGVYVQCVPWIDGFAIIPKIK